jgi:hypothetical protein
VVVAAEMEILGFKDLSHDLGVRTYSPSLLERMIRCVSVGAST